jgi:hypothetical protein
MIHAVLVCWQMASVFNGRCGPAGRSLSTNAPHVEQSVWRWLFLSRYICATPKHDKIPEGFGTSSAVFSQVDCVSKTAYLCVAVVVHSPP